MSETTKRLGPGRYLLDGERAPSVTTITREGFPKPALVGWAAREVASYAVDHWTELEEKTPSARYRVLERAQWTSRDQAAVKGTDVHRFVERLATGEEVDVPEALLGHVDAYLRFVDDWKPRELLVEASVLHRAIGYMGTLDLVARLCDGRVWLLDWKTGGSGVWPETALQLAAYRYAERYLDPDGNEQAMLDVDACGALWLRADGYDLLPVVAGREEFRAFRYTKAVADFRGYGKRPREELIGEALTPPLVESAS